MAEANKPPPYQTLVAAAAGGFGGAILGVVAATTMMGEGDNGNSNATPQTGKNNVEVVETNAALR